MSFKNRIINGEKKIITFNFEGKITLKKKVTWQFKIYLNTIVLYKSTFYKEIHEQNSRK